MFQFNRRLTVCNSRPLKKSVFGEQKVRDSSLGSGITAQRGRAGDG
jgi:hypothetical protein